MDLCSAAVLNVQELYFPVLKILFISKYEGSSAKQFVDSHRAAEMQNAL